MAKKTLTGKTLTGETLKKSAYNPPASANKQTPRTLYKIGRREEAFALAKHILQKQPQNAAAAIICLRFLFASGKYEECANEARQTIIHHPKFSKAWGILFFSLLNLRRYDEATACIEEAIKRLPEKKLLRNCLGLVYRFAGNHEKEVETFRACVSKCPHGKWNKHNMLWAFLREPNAYTNETYAALTEAT